MCNTCANEDYSSSLGPVCSGPGATGGGAEAGSCALLHEAAKRQPSEVVRRSCKVGT